MLRTTLILISVAAVAVAVAVIVGGVRIAGDGPHTVQTRTVGTFDRIDLRGSTDVVVTHGTARTLTVSGGRNRVRNVITRVQSGTLVVEQRDSDATLHLWGDGATVTVSTPSLVGARVDGSGDLSVAGLAGGPLRIRADGSGDVDAHGRLDVLDAAADGSGDLHLSDLVARSATVNLSGSGDADVHAVSILAVVASGSGDVNYAGNPRVTRDVSGSGDVSHG
jgi:hypothetical protein